MRTSGHTTRSLCDEARGCGVERRSDRTLVPTETTPQRPVDAPWTPPASLTSPLRGACSDAPRLAPPDARAMNGGDPRGSAQGGAMHSFGGASGAPMRVVAQRTTTQTYVTNPPPPSGLAAAVPQFSALRSALSQFGADQTRNAAAVNEATEKAARAESACKKLEAELAEAQKKARGCPMRPQAVPAPANAFVPSPACADARAPRLQLAAQAVEVHKLLADNDSLRSKALALTTQVEALNSVASAADAKINACAHPASHSHSPPRSVPLPRGARVRRHSA